MPGLDMLNALDFVSLIALFWYLILFEVPRYVIGAFVILLTARVVPNGTGSTDLTVSVLLVGHNEAKCLPKAVEGLAEQTIAKQWRRLHVVVVDDGSTDGMIEVARRLQREGKVDEVLHSHQRGGKSAGVNLGLSACTGDVVFIVDVDTTFDRDAFEIALGYFTDPHVGAVSGTLGVRNCFSNLLTRSQAIEYAIGLMLGRRIADMLGILTIVSGAFGAFRRVAIESVGRQDVEVGEDADLTLKLRRAGWRIRFAPDALGLTDVPETVTALIAQRLRWDRGLITIWVRKFRAAFDPWRSNFRLIEVLALADVIMFQVVLALAFPLYLIWLWYFFSDFAVTIMSAMLVGYFVVDLLVFGTAAMLGLAHPFRLLAYLPLHSLIQMSLMRLICLVAIIQELVFFSSYRDPYVPARIMQQLENG